MSSKKITAFKDFIKSLFVKKVVLDPPEEPDTLKRMMAFVDLANSISWMHDTNPRMIMIECRYINSGVITSTLRNVVMLLGDKSIDVANIKNIILNDLKVSRSDEDMKSLYSYLGDKEYITYTRFLSLVYKYLVFINEALIGKDNSFRTGVLLQIDPIFKEIERVINSANKI